MKTYKMTTIDWCYCLTKHLNHCISDFKKIAAEAHSPVYVIKINEDITVKEKSFAVIGIEIKESEYHLILNYYREI